LEAQMKRYLMTMAAVFAICTAALRADVTIVQSTTVEGGMAAMGGGNVSPKLTTRVKGMKSRTDIDSGPIQVATITDLTAKQVVILRPDQKTATYVSTTPPSGTGSPAPAAPPKLTLPDVRVSIKPTGRSQVIDGVTCAEYAFTSSMNMGEMGGAQMPPEAAAMMKDMKMNMQGSMWVAREVPGAAEYMAFQKAASGSDMAAAVAGASGVNIPGMDKMMKAMGEVNGMAYLTEMTMTVEGTGPMADMMKQMGAMKITTRTTSVTTDAIADDAFTIPADYKVIKP
jgi:hypothetical protein